MATFTELVRKRRQSGGTVGGSLSYGLRERAKETFDPRRIFKQDGLLTALFPKLRAYKSGKVGDIKKSSSKLLTPEISSTEPLLDSIQQDTKLSAKNSMVLPAIHRDVNVIRQNIIKLVKLKGGQPTNKADMWFMKASTMEAAYENRTPNRGKPKTTPTKENKEDKPTEEKQDDGFFKAIMDKFSGLGSSILKIGAFVTGIAGAVTWIGSKLIGLIRFLSGIPLLGKLAGALGLTAMVTEWDSFQKSMGDVTGAFSGVANAGNNESTTSSLSAGGPSPASVTNQTNTESKSYGQQAGAWLKGAVSQETGNNLIAAGGLIAGRSAIKSGMKAYGRYKATGAALKEFGKTSNVKYLMSSPKHRITGGIAKIGQSLGNKLSVGVAARQSKRVVSTAVKTGKAVLLTTVKMPIWDRFLAFLARRAPGLFAKVATRLAGAGALATIPFAGWIASAISLGLNAMLLYEVYQLWKEFNKTEDEQSTSPTQESNTQTDSSAIKGVKGAADERQATAVNKLQNDKKIYESEAFKKWQEKKNASFFEKGMFAKYGVDAYRKEMGDKLAESSAGIVDAKRAAQKPVVNVKTKQKTETLPTNGSTGSLEQASVYDLHFMKRLGLQYDYSGVAN